MQSTGKKPPAAAGKSAPAANPNALASKHSRSKKPQRQSSQPKRPRRKSEPKIQAQAKTKAQVDESESESASKVSDSENAQVEKLIKKALTYAEQPVRVQTYKPETEDADIFDTGQPSYEPKSKSGKCCAKCYTALEETFIMGPGFNTREGCTNFVRNILAVLGFKMLFSTATAAFLSFCSKNWITMCSNVPNQIRRKYWLIIFPIFVYAALYINLRRVCCCGTKCKGANRLLHLLVFTLCEMCIAGVGTVIGPPYLALIILTTMTTTCITISFYSWTALEVEVRGSWMFLIMFPLIIFYAAGTTITLCFFMESPSNRIDLMGMILNFLITFPSCLIIFGVLLFEIQRLIAGRRCELSMQEWGLAALIVSLSFLYPAFLIRKLTSCSKCTQKVHPEPELEDEG